MANDVLSLLTVTLSKAGPVKSNSKRIEGDLKFSDGIECHGFQFGIQTPTDPNSLKLTGRRAYEAFITYLKIDETTPKLMQAAASGEVATALALYVNQIDDKGKPIKTLSYEFTNCVILKLQQFHGNAQGGGGTAGSFTHLHDYVVVSWGFEQITFTHLVGKTTYADSLLTGIK
jgi:type VI secretion system Hcp family effector